ncbi:MAG: discoidin domain-containing protein [Fibrobacterales bacterium]
MHTFKKLLLLSIFVAILYPLNAFGQDIAQGKTYSSSPLENSTYAAAKAFDGDNSSEPSRWASEHSADPQWIMVDLESIFQISDITIYWEDAYAVDYRVEVSLDNITWIVIDDLINQNGGQDAFTLSEYAQYVRVYCTKRYTFPFGTFGYSIYTLEVQGIAATTTILTATAGGTVTPTNDIILAQGANSGITATPQLGYTFKQWNTISGTPDVASTTQTSTTITPQSDSEIEAEFFPHWEYTLSASTGGSIVLPTSGTVEQGDSTTITAQANPGYYFVDWEVLTGAATFGSVTTLSTSITPSIDCTVRANFLKFDVVTIQPGVGGTTLPLNTISIKQGEPDTITATSDTGYYFSHWVTVSGAITYSDSLVNAPIIRPTGDATIQPVFKVASTLSLTSVGNGTLNIAQQANLKPSDLTPIVATPATDYSFSHWSVDSGTVHITDTQAASTTVSIDDNAHLIAHFVLNQWKFTLNSNGGGTVNPAGQSLLDAGSFHSIDATPDPLYSFWGWQIDSGNATFQNLIGNSSNGVQLHDSTLITALFAQQKNLTILTDGNGTVGTGSIVADSASSVPITAHSTTHGYIFSHWTVDTTSLTVDDRTDSISTVIVESDGIITAHFSPVYAIYMNAGAGGTVVSDSLYPTIAGTPYSISATALSNHYFSHWALNSGTAVIANSTLATTSVTIDNANPSNVSVTANFVPAVTLTVNASANGSIVSPSGGTINNINPLSNNQVITAQSNSYFEFSRWEVISGTATITNANAINTTISITTDVELLAHFTPRMYNADIVSRIGGTVTPAGIHSLQEQLGDTTITAQPDSGYIFKEWIGTNGSHISQPNAATTTLYITNNTTVTATYEPFYKVAIEVDSNGTTSDTLIENLLTSKDSLIVATPDSSYQFSHWSVDSGSVVIADIYNSTTRVQLNSDGGITAHFVKEYTLTVDSSSIGLIKDHNSIDVDTLVVGENVVFNLYANALPRFIFENWEVIYGSVTISDSTQLNPSFSLQSDAEIALSFRKKGLYEITAFDSTYTFNIHGDTNTQEAFDGVYFYLEGTGNPARIIIEEATGLWNKRLVYYGTDSTFSLPVSQSGFVAGNYTEEFTQLNTGYRYYYKVVPQNIADVDKDFTIRYQQGGSLLILSQYGTVHPVNAFTMYPGESQQLIVNANDGFDFTHWEVANGAIRYINGSSTTTDVTIQADTLPVILKAHYTLEPGAIPTLTIGKPDISDHPTICVSAQVKDTTNNFYFTGLDTSNFTVWQDHNTSPPLVEQNNIVRPIHVTAELMGINVSLVVDESGSMSTGDRIGAAKDAIYDFIHGMQPYDQTGIVGFYGGSSVTTHSTMTSDTNTLKTATSRLRAYGGSTDIKDGAFGGLENIKNEVGPKTLIVFSDGQDSRTANAHTMAEILDTALKYDITVYAIGLENSMNSEWNTVATQTGGEVWNNRPKSQLSLLYQAIRNKVLAQYKICYESPDKVFNGDTNDVAIEVDIFANTSRDTTWWDETNEPPVVVLTDSTAVLSGRNNTIFQAIPIEAVVTDDGIIAHVDLYYRETGNGTYSSIPMHRTSGDTFRTVIPSNSVIRPGVDYYIMARDSYNLNGKSPKVQYPWATPHQLWVDNSGPTIEINDIGCYLQGATSITISGKTWDADDIGKVEIHYKYLGDPFYMVDSLNWMTSDSSFSTTLSTLNKDSLVYYVSSEDTYGLTSRYPDTTVLIAYQCLDIDTTQALLLPSLVESDTLFDDTTWVSLRSESDTLYSGIEIYYTTDTNQTLNYSSPHVISGDSIFIDSTTTVTMIATYNGSKSDTTTKTFYKRVPLLPPWFVKANDTQFPDSMFADTLKLIVKSNDSLVPGMSIWYSTDTSASRTYTSIAHNDTLIISDTTRFVLYETAPHSYNSDTAYYNYYSAAASPDPYMILAGDTIQDTVFFQDSVCFTLQNGLDSTTIGESTVPTTNFPHTVNAGDTLCVNKNTSLYAQAYSKGFSQSGIVNWNLVHYELAPKPTIVPSQKHFETVWLDVTITHPDSNARIYYTLDTTLALADSNGIAYHHSSTERDTLKISETTTVTAVAYIEGRKYLISNMDRQTFHKDSLYTDVLVTDTTGDTLALWNNGSFITNKPLTELNNQFNLAANTNMQRIDTIQWHFSFSESKDSLTLFSTDPTISYETIEFLSGPNQIYVREEFMNNPNLLESRIFDTLNIWYQNPHVLDDTVSISIPVRPSPRPSNVIVYDSPSRTEPVSAVVSSTDLLYVTVFDQLGSRDSLYEITVTTKPHIVSQEPDTLVATLMPLTKTSDKYRLEHGEEYHSSFRLNLLQDVSLDSALDIRPGDTIMVTYKDPIEGDSVSTYLIYDSVTEKPGDITIIDKNLDTLSNGSVVNGTNDSLTIILSDDYLYNQQMTTQAMVYSYDSIGGFTDTLYIDLSLDHDSLNWSALLPLNNAQSSDLTNSTIDWYQKSSVTVAIPTHNSRGIAEDTLYLNYTIAIPNQVPAIVIEDTLETRDSIIRDTRAFTLSVTDQSFSRFVDTLTASVSCVNLGDLETGYLLVESDTTSGLYELVTAITKNERTLVPENDSLQCAINDIVEVTYRDPIYGDTTRAHAAFSDSITNALFFMDDSISAIDTLYSALETLVPIRATALSPSLDAIDSVLVSVTNDHGDTLLLWLYETNAYSSIYTGSVPFEFTTALHSTLDSSITVPLNYDSTGNSSIVSAQFVEDPLVTARFTALSLYKVFTSATIVDTDRNGYADALFLDFSGPVALLPKELNEFFWSFNDTIAPFPISKENISYNRIDDVIDSTRVIVDLSDIEMELLETALCTLATPHVTLPQSNYFGGRSQDLIDSVSPRIISVLKVPSEKSSEHQLSGSKVKPDMFEFTFSEAIYFDLAQAESVWMQQFSYSPGCNDHTTDLTIESVVATHTERKRWIVEIDENIPFTRGCITVNPDSLLINDSLNNVIGTSPIRITGKDRGKPAKVKMKNPVAGAPGPDETYFVPGTDIEAIIPDTLAVLTIVAKERYVAKVNIFDNTGNYIQTLETVFGDAGEFDQVARATEDGSVNHILWNQKASNGTYVGSGVYIWIVTLYYDSGNIDSFTVSSGVLRKQNPGR